MQPFQVGDVVRLKTGGPELTVTEIKQGTNGYLVTCMWFNSTSDEANKLLTADFPDKTLVAVTPDAA